MRAVLMPLSLSLVSSTRNHSPLLSSTSSLPQSIAPVDRVTVVRNYLLFSVPLFNDNSPVSISASTRNLFLSLVSSLTTELLSRGMAIACCFHSRPNRCPSVLDNTAIAIPIFRVFKILARSWTLRSLALFVKITEVISGQNYNESSSNDLLPSRFVTLVISGID
jgi:hypothetical protein